MERPGVSIFGEVLLAQWDSAKMESFGSYKGDVPSSPPAYGCKPASRRSWGLMMGPTGTTYALCPRRGGGGSSLPSVACGEHA
jgi:hypothetical protein